MATALALDLSKRILPPLHGAWLTSGTSTPGSVPASRDSTRGYHLPRLRRWVCRSRFAARYHKTTRTVRCRSSCSPLAGFSRLLKERVKCRSDILQDLGMPLANCQLPIALLASYLLNAFRASRKSASKEAEFPAALAAMARARSAVGR